jgi:hypothetical protein
MEEVAPKPAVVLGDGSDFQRIGLKAQQSGRPNGGGLNSEWV